MGEAVEQIYEACLKLEKATPALERIIVLLNMPTELQNQKEKELAAEKKTESMRAELSKSQGGVLDSLPIISEDVSFKYAGVQFSFCGRIQFSQGQLVCVTGRHSSGKSTLLMLF